MQSSSDKCHKDAVIRAIEVGKYCFDATKLENYKTARFLANEPHTVHHDKHAHGWHLDIIFCVHDDVIKSKHFPRYWPFVREIHRSPVKSEHKGQWRGAFMSSLICAWINRWVYNGEASDLRRYRTHYAVTLMGQTYHGSLGYLCNIRVEPTTNCNSNETYVILFQIYPCITY